MRPLLSVKHIMTPAQGPLLSCLFKGCQTQNMRRTHTRPWANKGCRRGFERFSTGCTHQTPERGAEALAVGPGHGPAPVQWKHREALRAAGATEGPVILQGTLALQSPSWNERQAAGAQGRASDLFCGPFESMHRAHERIKSIKSA